MNPEVVTIVSGLPRSGTSMMMRMLEAGGIPVLVDGIRSADEDNPKGYYEFERVKQIKTDKAWLPDARGKVVKMISQLVADLPPGFRYKVVFMRREMSEILKSQKAMLVRNQKPVDAVADQKMADLYEKHLAQITGWLARQPHFDVLYVKYNEMLEDPTSLVPRINEFLGGGMNEDAMRAVVDRSLYRNKA